MNKNKRSSEDGREEEDIYCLNGYIFRNVFCSDPL